MCWKCDNPDATDADYFDKIAGVIDANGWFVQGVEKDRWRPGFAYTVGLTMFGHPELLVTGMAHRAAAHLLNGLAHPLVWHAAPAFVAGDFHLWPGSPAIEIVDVAEPTVHLVMAEGMYGSDIRAVQLVYADDHGRWPWEVGFRGHQPVLGPRSQTWADQ
ncbi:MAG TPA: DUF4262 domain-containing protein [Nocardioidaceae bacterium]|nr:DUF4262 domain-containing protein [Nocardioidaceae bacterium]